MIDESNVNDHDHLLSPEEWDKAVTLADQFYLERVAAEDEKGGAGDYAPMGLTPRIVRYDNVPDKSSTLVRKQLYIIHTGETPLKVGYAESLTRWGSAAYDPRASWHFFVDPATIAFWISIQEASWSAAGGNPYGIGFEQAGYASFTREQWLAPDGLRQIDLLAQAIVTHAKLPKSGLRWLSDAQVLAVITGKDTTTVGLCTHEQVSRLSGRTSRTDPGKGYPKDILLAFCIHYHPETVSLPSKPAVPPAPAPATRWTRGNVVTMQGFLEVPKDGKWGAGTDAKAQAFRRVAFSGLPHSTADIRAVQAIVDVGVDGSLGRLSRAAVKRDITKLWQPLLKVAPDGNWGAGTDRAFVAFHREWRGR